MSVKYKKKDIPTMSQTCAEIIILDEWVELTWAGRNIPYYQQLGYEYTGKHDRFWCHIDDLSHGSQAYVLVKCPECDDERESTYQSITRKGNSLCAGCGAKHDLSGMSFGNWRIVELDHKSSSRWVCECSCGIVKSVSASTLVNGESSSCGCDRVRDLSGRAFGRLTAIELDSKRSGTSACWLCECECGNTCVVSSQNLTRGRTVSCGCYKTERMSGENSNFWNPNLTDEERLIGRNIPGYQQYIKAVMKRDNWTCQCCDQYGGSLEVHHLYSYSDYPEYQIDADYGVTLCEVCHDEFHWDFMGSNRIPCTPDDYTDWINSK